MCKKEQSKFLCPENLAFSKADTFTKHRLDSMGYQYILTWELDVNAGSKFIVESFIKTFQ